ncbi:energy-coupling factor transporter transmembrane component T family protein [Roseibium sp.]|uniref:energy-coupling factor transporter transmembrane component T family protein n=1 Tax=Roseibium sp. TaxID=1936156 RepID=UPI003D152508
MISVYLSGDSWAHRLPAGAKLLAVAIGSLLLFRTETLWVFVVCLALVLAAYVSLGRGAVQRLRLLKGLSIFLAAILALHWLSGTVMDGVIAILRLCVMVLAASFVSMTTRMDDMLAAVMPLFRPLEWAGFSARKPALGVTLVLRFAPHLMEIFAVLREAYQARTGKKSSWRLIAPFALQALKMSDNVAEALAARGGSQGLTLK